MTTIPAGSKLIFTILVYRDSPQAFRWRWLQGKADCIADWPENATVAAYTYSCAFPPSQYGNLAGFFELYWDNGTRFLCTAYFESDRRKRYGKELARKYRWPLGRGSHQLIHGDELSTFSPYSKDCERRQSLRDALHQIREKASQLGAYADISQQLKMVDLISLDELFRDAYWRRSSTRRIAKLKGLENQSGTP